MSKYTANTTLSYHGQVLARAGKTFDCKGLPVGVLQAWAEKGLCSPVPSMAKARKAAPAASKTKAAGSNLKETNNGFDGK